MRYSIMAIACAITAPTVCADTIDAAFLGTLSGSSVRVDLSGEARNVFSGQIRYALTNGTGMGAGLSGEFVTFCSELTELVNSSNLGYGIFDIPANPFDNATPLNAERTQAVVNLFAAFGDAAVATTDNAFASAFQITIWEIIYDFDPMIGASSIDVTSGALMVTDTSSSALSASVSAHIATFASAATTAGNKSGLFSIRREGAQDQIVLIPAPGSLALLGLAGTVALRRRR